MLGAGRDQGWGLGRRMVIIRVDEGNMVRFTFGGGFREGGRGSGGMWRRRTQAEVMGWGSGLRERLRGE
jgi:hypothetical protein